ncbi:MAG: energy-coupling factor transporter ATP-binding protein EcfA2 [Candidatus Nitrosomirales archaeon]
MGALKIQIYKQSYGAFYGARCHDKRNMRLLRFRVQNYKKINDSGWITCSNLTAFVGKNEAGKSALFKGLSKLNPSDGQPYDGLREFPRRRYTDEFTTQDWIVSTAEFELSAPESEELGKICNALTGVQKVTCSRHYSGKSAVVFEPKPTFPDTSIQKFLQNLRRWQMLAEKSKAPEGKGEQLVQIKNVMLPLLTQKIQLLAAQPSSLEVSESIVSEVSNGSMAQFNEPWQKDEFKKIIEELGKFKEELQVRSQLKQAEQGIQAQLPKFIYFDRYDVIDSAVNINDFIHKIKQEPNNPRLRTTKCLFQHVGLDLDVIQKLDPTQPEKNEGELRRMADERAIRMSSASAAMTQKFAQWWEQRKHKFKYQVDGRYFRVWVSDDLDPSEIELDQRSGGMQYFFSFYLVFLVEAQGQYRNAILLLDEPGLHYHGTAQQKNVKFLEKLSEQNQMLYSTHSPFMIDPDNLDRVRIVYEDEKDGSTRVTQDPWPKDNDSLFPLQAGLGYAVAQTLFYANKQLVVEGLTDYSLLKAMNQLLSSKGKTTLIQEAIVTPTGGIRNLMPLASILIGNQIKMAILLDGDQAGITKGKEVKEKLLQDCLTISTYTGKQPTTIEDLFPEDFYIDAVKEAYPTVNFAFTTDEKKISSITERIESLFKRTGSGRFEKWKPTNIILERISSSKREHQIPDTTINQFEAIFKDVNRILST